MKPHSSASPTKFLSLLRLFLILGLGALMGVFAFALSGMETRWIVFSLAGLLGLIILLVTPDKQQLLATAFVLSFQIDVFVRFLYGHAQSSEGIAISLVVVVGFGLTVWYVTAGYVKDFQWAGSLRRPITALFVCIVVSILASSEHFVGVTMLWFAIQQYFLYWLALNMVQSLPEFKRVIWLLLMTLILQSLIYFIQSALGFTFDFSGQIIQGGEVARPGGTVSTNPAGFTSFIMHGLMIAIALFLAKLEHIRRWQAFVIMALGTAAIGLSFTRAAWIGMVLGLAGVVWMGIRRRIIKPALIIWILAISFMAAAILTPTMMTRVDGDYGDSTSSQSTWDERLGLMRIALRMVEDHPLTGVGYGAYQSVLKSYAIGLDDQWLSTVHNEFLRRAAETGLPGALAFIALLVMGFRMAVRLSRAQNSFISTVAIGWIGALVAVTWQMAWVPWAGWSYNAMLWFMLGLMDGVDSKMRLGVGEWPSYSTSSSNG